MKFSIITVALNPGDKLNQTLESVFAQTCRDYEIILKDGGSTDGSMDKWNGEGMTDTTAKQVFFFREKDSGIYDAMNQAVAHATGDFVLFLNCGDTFADEKVLERTRDFILKYQEKYGKNTLENMVVYGDTYDAKRQVVISSAPAITGFTCYRNIPCHQSCFYSLNLCQQKPFDLQYKIRADYEQFLWCFYEAKATFLHMGAAVSAYEGDGFSEKKDNQIRDKEEHLSITKRYMGKGELIRYQVLMALTLAPLRKKMAQSKVFSSVYHKCKELVYKNNG